MLFGILDEDVVEVDRSEVIVEVVTSRMSAEVVNRMVVEILGSFSSVVK